MQSQHVHSVGEHPATESAVGFQPQGVFASLLTPVQHPWDVVEMREKLKVGSRHLRALQSNQRCITSPSKSRYYLQTSVAFWSMSQIECLHCSGGQFPCPMCTLVCSTSRLLQEHVEVHLQAEDSDSGLPKGSLFLCAFLSPSSNSFTP